MVDKITPMRDLSITLCAEMYKLSAPDLCSSWVRSSFSCDLFLSKENDTEWKYIVQITPRVLRVWARILCKMPSSRLVVKCKPFCCDSVREGFLAKLEELGVESLRVDLLPLILLNHDHMQAYSLMDIR
jgi:hypothetical protein